MASRADLLAYRMESERQETSSSSQSLSDDHFDATPAQRSDSGCTRSGDTGEHIVDMSVSQDTIENYNQDQLSNTDARIEAVEKSISELHKRLNGLCATKLQSEASTEANHEYCSDDEVAKAFEKKVDSETRRVTHSCELEAVSSTSSVADKENAGVRRRLRTNAMCADAREIFATTKKDLESGVAAVQEARWSQSQDLDLDDSSITENTQIEDIPVVQVPRVQVVEKTVEIPQLQTGKKITETPQTQTVQRTQAPESLGITPVCQVAQTGHVETLQRKQPVINEKINQVTKHVEISQLQIDEKAAETSKIQMIQGTQTSESLGTALVCQLTQAGHVEVKSRTRSRDCDTGRTSGTHEDMKERAKAQIQV